MQIHRRLRKITDGLLTVGDVIYGLLLGSSRLVQHCRCSEGIWLRYVERLIIRGTYFTTFPYYVYGNALDMLRKFYTSPPTNIVYHLLPAFKPIYRKTQHFA